MTYRFSDQVAFKPWVGGGYGRSNQVGLPNRLLVLGESHYYEREPYRHLTRDVVREWLDGETNSFLTKVSQVLTGRHHTECDHEKIWQAISFYNFVQAIVADVPGRPPVKWMWDEAEQPFFEVLTILAPTHVVACGKRLWEQLPMEHWRSAQFEDRGWYRLGKLQIPILRIHHPSWGFSPPRWSPVVRAFLGAADN